MTISFPCKEDEMGRHEPLLKEFTRGPDFRASYWAIGSLFAADKFVILENNANSLEILSLRHSFIVIPCSHGHHLALLYFTANKVVTCQHHGRVEDVTSNSHYQSPGC
jgi:hypothetical protein